jgi:hypothetical protein
VLVNALKIVDFPTFGNPLQIRIYHLTVVLPTNPIDLHKLLVFAKVAADF